MHGTLARDSRLDTYSRNSILSCARMYSCARSVKAWAHSPQTGVHLTSLLRRVRSAEAICAGIPTSTSRKCSARDRIHKQRGASRAPKTLAVFMIASTPSLRSGARERKPSFLQTIDNQARGITRQGHDRSASRTPPQAFFILDRRKCPRHRRRPHHPVLLSQCGLPLVPSPRTFPERYTLIVAVS